MLRKVTNITQMKDVFKRFDSAFFNEYKDISIYMIQINNNKN